MNLECFALCLYVSEFLFFDEILTAYTPLIAQYDQ